VQHIFIQKTISNISATQVQQHLIFDRYRKCSMPDIIYLQEFVGPDCSSVLVQTSIKNKWLAKIFM